MISTIKIRDRAETRCLTRTTPALKTLWFAAECIRWVSMPIRDWDEASMHMAIAEQMMTDYLF